MNLTEQQLGAFLSDPNLSEPHQKICRDYWKFQAKFRRHSFDIKVATILHMQSPLSILDELNMGKMIPQTLTNLKKLEASLEKQTQSIEQQEEMAIVQAAITNFEKATNLLASSHSTE